MQGFENSETTQSNGKLIDIDHLILSIADF